MKDFGGYNLSKYSTIVFDMDGTLYFQNSLRLRMLLSLGAFYMCHPGRFREVLYIRMHRKLREDERFANDPEADLHIAEEVAEKYHTTPEKVRNVIDTWMIQKPQSAIRKSRDKYIIGFLNSMKNHGKKIYIYSDYPAELKCEALDIVPDKIYFPDGNRIQLLKPDPEGLKYILTENQLDSSEVLYIGDRDEKDGEVARKCNVDVIILPHNAVSRGHMYRKM